MDRLELMRRVGCVEQIGGVKEYIFSTGKAKGVRAIDVDTGDLCITILPDRCMDIAQAKYKGKSISWISKTGVVAPQYYEKEGAGFLRSFYGGLLTTCGLKNIGAPVGDQGLHGRIANTPAEKTSVRAEWIDGEYIIEVSGEMRESVVFGENLLLKRTIRAKLFCNKIDVEDTIINEGFSNENIALCYHCNFGYPLVQEGSRIINVPLEFKEISSPIKDKEEECIPVKYKDDVVTVGIENNDIGAYITYERKNLPEFVIWKMMGESEYAVGLEPRTSEFGGPRLSKNDAYVELKPFEEYKTKLKFELKEVL